VLSRHYGEEVVRMSVRIAPRHFGAIRKMGGVIRRVPQTLPAENP
jgi:hypothetical protein